MYNIIFDKIKKIIKDNEEIDIEIIINKMLERIYPNITNDELDNELADICINLSTINPIYSYIGGRILVSNLHNKTLDIFSEKMKLIKVINNEWLKYVIENKEELDNIIDYNRDYMYDYFGFKTLEKSYLLKNNNIIIERPQDMLLRTAITLQKGNIDLIKITYNELSLGKYTHASPTLFNTGTNNMQLSSCFIEDTKILTINDGVKYIKDIKINDLVITHKNRIKKVLQIHKNLLNDRIIYELKVNSSKLIYVTGDHRFLTISQKDKEPKWRRIDMLNRNYYVAISSYNGNIKKYELECGIIIDYDLAFIIGLYIANNKVIKNDEINFICTNTNIISIITNKIYKLFNIDTYIIKCIKLNKYIIKYNSLKLFNFLNTLINNNYIYSIMINWDIELIKGFINGLSILNYKYNEHIYYISHAYGINNNTYNYLIINDNQVFLKINSIKKTNNKSEYVYTLGIEDDNSYSVEGLICENCFLLGTNDDLEDITKTWNTCSLISKWAGGIGLHISNIRSKNSIIKGTGGKSNGIIPFLKVFNEISRWIDQGGKRPGSIAIYLEPHHADIINFLDLKKNFGSETDRARDLFYALWISDLFMNKVEKDEDWYLFSPDDCINLNETFGNKYEELYLKYVNEGKYKQKINARKLWISIIEAQIETGMPYILYKDTINYTNNQKNLGTIKSSNLCAEIVQYSDFNEVAVCNLASIAINKFIKYFDYSIFNNVIIYTKPNCMYCIYAKNYLINSNIKFIEKEYNSENLNYLKSIITNITFPQIFNNNILIGGWDDLYNFTKNEYNYDELYNTAYLATINLNNVIDINFYPVEKAKLSNIKHRPIGLGIQGLADTLVLLNIPYDSDESVIFNQKIMEIIYLASLTASNDIAFDRYNKLKEYNNIDIPLYYDNKYNNNDKIYHELKLNKFELNNKSTTIGAYSSFEGSLFSEGKLQFDMYENKINLNYPEKWNILKNKIIKYGTRNSMLTALMPTASTSQILGNNECFEFFTNNIYTRKTHAGDFIMVNKYLINNLKKIGLWNIELKNKIIAYNGSIQQINEIPNNIKRLYKTIWEIPQIWTLKNAIARSYFIDQSQSMNIFMDTPDYQRLTSCHFHSWKNKLKTGMYYLRSKPSSDAIKFTIDPNIINSCTNCSG
jgi:ribonucleotide reductase alpha subunit